MLDVSFFLLGLNVNSIPIASGDFTATSVIDAVSGAYTLNGAPVALADIVNTTGGLFNPATDIDAGGIKMIKDDGGGIQVDFTGALLTAMLSGFTIVIEMLTGVDAFTIGVQAYHAPDYSFDAYSHYDAEFAEHQFTYSLGGADGNTLDGFTDTDIGPGDNVTQVSPSTVVRIAYTLTDNRVALSVAGDTPVVYLNAAIVAQSNAVSFDPVAQLADATARVRKFSVYAPPIADADLPALTAP